MRTASVRISDRRGDNYFDEKVSFKTIQELVNQCIELSNSSDFYKTNISVNMINGVLTNQENEILIMNSIF